MDKILVKDIRGKISDSLKTNPNLEQIKFLIDENNQKQCADILKNLDLKRTFHYIIKKYKKGSCKVIINLK